MPKPRQCCDTPKGPAPHAASCPNNPLNHGVRTAPVGVAERAGAEMRRAVRAMTPAQRVAFLDEIAGEMPDGAYLAMAHDLGVSIDDLVEGEG